MRIRPGHELDLLILRAFFTPERYAHPRWFTDDGLPCATRARDALETAAVDLEHTNGVLSAALLTIVQLIDTRRSGRGPWRTLLDRAWDREGDLEVAMVVTANAIYQYFSGSAVCHDFGATERGLEELRRRNERALEWCRARARQAPAMVPELELVGPSV